jgi:hypothetical protein
MAEDGASTLLSPQALAYYKRMLEDTVFIKRQQWAVTNYAALIYAAIIWFAHNWSFTPTIAWVLYGFSIATAVIGTVLLIWFQVDLCDLRKRLASASSYSFRGAEKTAFNIKDKDDHPFGRGWHILTSLIIVCIAGAILAVFAVYYSGK